MGVEEFEVPQAVWALGSCCSLARRPFDPALLTRALVPPVNAASLVRAARELGFAAAVRPAGFDEAPQRGGFTVMLASGSGDGRPGALGLLLRVEGGQATWIAAGSTQPTTEPVEGLRERSFDSFLVLQVPVAVSEDPDAPAASSFGFHWFVPELLKHRRVWRDVLGASLVLQLLALGLPLFTQAVIDKVVVHRTESTLVAIAVGMAIFTVATAVLTWVRQYLVLHTGNRVDAVLAAAVFDHLFRLPPRYFERRPTGVVAARLHGVETIREFVSSAAVTLVLDIPFLLVAVAVMLSYSAPLTGVVLTVLALIGGLSLAIAPVFQRRLNEQFLLGARNQAFVTEYIAGFETVKSLQLEPQLNTRYAGYLATYLQSGFRTRQIGNSYQVAATTLEQGMTLVVLLGGAWLVMHPDPASRDVFTIGMLVAFQMFAGKLSQPVMRLVGLWQQFQQARLSVDRLGDLMNAPTEPYTLVPARQAAGPGHIRIEGLAFRYGEDRPFLYQDLGLELPPGRTVALMGPSGSGKSTLAKLLQGFLRPTAGRITIDGVDVRHLGANELRAYFGVVPQETVLFSGTLYDNLLMAHPHATFEQVVQACRMAEIDAAIQALPQGYQTPIGERGAGLSGGQKQRLAIARALLKRPRVLIFDEATSALDAETAEHFARTVNALKGKVSMLFITHAVPKGLKIDEVVHLGAQGAKTLRAAAPAEQAR